MTEQTSDRPRRPRKPLWRRVLRWVLQTVVVIIALGIVAYAVGNYWAARSISDQIETIRTAGHPLTFAELDRLAPKVDESRDSGPYYAAALALVRKVDRERIPGYEEVMATGTIDPAMLGEARRRVEANALVLDMLDRGSGLDDCNYDLELRYGIAAVLPRLNASRSLAKAASMRTRLLAFEGRGDDAVAPAIASLRMLRMFDRQPVLIAQLVKIGCAALFCDDVKAILEHGSPSEQSLRELESVLVQVEKSIDLRGMFVAERVYYLELSRNAIGGASRDLQSAHVAEQATPPVSPQLPSVLPMRIVVAKSLPVYGRFIDAAAKGWPDMLDASKKIAAEPRSRWEMFAQLSAPSFARAVTTAARLEAELRSAIVAVRIERYRLANEGRLPDSLAQLPDAQTLPTDPFTGGALVYRRTADGYCVYGLGEDRRDAGGEHLNERGPNWGIRVRVPAKAPVL